LVRRRSRARELCRALNDTTETQADERRDILGELFASGGESALVQPPFHCDYGINIELGEEVFFNFSCIILDVCRVRIGAYSLFGPGVQILTPLHPMNAAERRGKENGAPVDIGADVWVGGGALILPGVSIGPGSVIGAGSVVTRAIPGGVFAAGNPCRVIREITE
jgi:maltose O-acetyltransferase